MKIKSKYYQENTKNKSFINMSKFLKANGIKNSKLCLTLNDNDLMNIDPYDPNISRDTKQKIIEEVQNNFWYFIREVVRFGWGYGKMERYHLDLGNLTMNYLTLAKINTNIKYKQNGYKTGKASLCLMLWSQSLIYFDFNSSIVFKYRSLINALPHYILPILSEVRPVSISKYSISGESNIIYDGFDYNKFDVTEDELKSGHKTTILISTLSDADTTPQANLIRLIRAQCPFVELCHFKMSIQELQEYVKSLEIPILNIHYSYDDLGVE